MDPPRRYSVSPLPSMCTGPEGRPGVRPSILEMTRELVQAVQPSWRKKTLKAVFAEAKAIGELAEMMDAGADLDSPSVSKTRPRKRRK
jgi:hypothetical protein